MNLLRKLTSVRHIYTDLDHRIGVLGLLSPQRLFNVASRSCSAPSQPRQVCVIGSGPAGFYTTMQLIKSDPNVTVDIYEKLAVPYGLVRYGVAPDHPEVKNCINSFSAVANQSRCNFFGNVTIGTDVTVPELREHYDAVVLASGAWQDRKLNIPGEKHMISARQLVGWYNGLPQDSWLKPPLQDAEHAVVVGLGNVALDVARVLLTPVHVLKKLDVPEPVLEQLSKSRIKRVTLVGRRAPQHSAFTIKEFREMTKLESVGCDLHKEDCQHLAALLPDMPRPKRRLMELILKTADGSASTLDRPRVWAMKFMRSPLEVEVNDGKVKALHLAINRLEGETAVASTDTEVLPCDMLLRSVGYQGLRFDPSLPYSEDTNTIANTNNRVTGMPGVYAAGWAATGPVGVIVSTMSESFACAKAILDDLNALSNAGGPVKRGSEVVLELLKSRNVKVISMSGATAILSEEEERGKTLGKLREKITSHEAMMEIAAASSPQDTK